MRSRRSLGSFQDTAQRTPAAGSEYLVELEVPVRQTLGRKAVSSLAVQGEAVGTLPQGGREGIRPW